MSPQDMSLTLSQRAARDQATAAQTGVEQRPAMYMDPEQEYGMAQLQYAQAKQEGSKSGMAYFKQHIDDMLAASEAQRQRLIALYHAGGAK